MFFVQVFAKCKRWIFFGACFLSLPVWAASNPIDLLRQQSSAIVGLEYLYAAPNKGPIFTRWGHALVRLVNPNIAPEKNLVLSFVAEVTDKQLNMAKGLFGGYRVILEVETLADASQQYNFDTEQNVERYILPLSQQDQNHFLLQLEDWLLHPEKMGDYTFLSNNCAGALSRLFHEAGLLPDTTRFPNHLADHLNAAGISPFPPLVMESSSRSWQSAEQALGLSHKQFLSLQSLSDEQLQVLVAKVDSLTLARILYLHAPLDAASNAKLHGLLRKDFSSISLDDLLYIRPVPAALYFAPENASEVQAINMAARAFFGGSSVAADLNFLVAMKSTEQKTAYDLLQVERIQASPGFFADNLLTLDASDISDPATDFQLMAEEGRLSLSYYAGQNEEVDLSDLATLSGTKILFRNGTSCALAADGKSLGEDCVLSVSRKADSYVLQIFGIQQQP